MKDNIYKILLGIILVLTGSLLGVVYNNLTARVDATEMKAESLQEKLTDLDMKTSETLIRIDNRLNNIERGVGIQIAKPSAYIESLKKTIAVPTETIE